MTASKTGAAQIRPIQGGDVSAVVALWSRSLPRDPISEARFARWLYADPDFDPRTAEGCWVAERGGEVAGMIRAITRVVPNDNLGLEEETGWIPVIFVAPERQRQGIGGALLDRALQYFRERRRRKIFVCGNTGSAPGYFFPGVDKDAYAGALAFFQRRGFVVDHEPIAMSRSLLDFDCEAFRAEAWSEGTNEGVSVEPLRLETLQPFLVFLKEEFPGDWNAVARAKIRSGDFSTVLIARLDGRVVGFCQWDGEHFGPFGVSAAVRGKKLGAKLFVEACRRIKAADGRSCWFNWADEDAARFYRRFGFEATRRFAILRLDLK